MERYDQILHDIAAETQRLRAKIDGLLGVELYGTDDRTHVLVVSQWVDNLAWGKAQWDDEMQDAVVARFTSARCVHSKLYRRIEVPSIP